MYQNHYFQKREKSDPLALRIYKKTKQTTTSL